jgi:uncharacterized protein (DUF1697 family)
MAEVQRRAGASQPHVALLRGINVGRAKRVAMADLRSLVEGLDYRDVRTLLNSGNVVFTVSCASAGNAAQRIERGLLKKTGVAARVTVLSGAELAGAVRDNPLLEIASDPSRLFVAFLNEPAHRERLTELAARSWAPEALALGERVAYLWCPDGVIASGLHAALSRVLKDGVTSRNWTTVLKLHALAGG